MAMVTRKIGAALAAGCSVVFKPSEETPLSANALGGILYAPMEINEAKADIYMRQEEIFGPVDACCRFHTEEDAVRLAHETPSGLSAFFYSRGLAKVWAVAKKLEAGIVGFNAGIISNEIAVFGDIKASGVGREISQYGLTDYTELK